MSATNVSQKAMLVYAYIGGWSATKLDKKASRKVTEDAGAVSDAARVNKHLLASADETLKAITKKGAEARRYMETETLPWDDAGNRLLPNVKSMGFIAAMTTLRKEYFELVDQFIAAYPALRARALHAMGDMADPSDYPLPDRIAEKFVFRVSYSPLPGGFTDDVRYGLTEDEVKALQQVSESRAKEQMGTALMAAWKRLLADVQQLVARLRMGDNGEYPIFRNSTVENVRATAESLATLNVFGDDELEAVRQRVLNELCYADPDTLRKSDTVRDAVASSGETLLADMLGILGE